MNKNIITQGLSIVCIALMAIGCTEKKPFTLNGKFENSTQKEIYVIALEADKFNIIDTIAIDETGAFTYSKDVPLENILRLSNAEYTVDIYARNNEEVTLKAKVEDMFAPYEVYGSQESIALSSLKQIYGAHQKTIEAINQDYESFITQNPNGNIDSLIKELELRSELSNVNMMDSIKLFIKDNPANLLGVFAFKFIDVEKDLDVLVNYSNAIKSSKYAEHPITVNFVKQVDLLSSVAIGRTAPDFTLADLNGKEQSLSNYKGKYVLVDFWASWCKPCRAENPEIVKVYNQFKNKNFTILGVSLDDDKDEWKEAVLKDKLTWAHISDLKGWDSKAAQLYRVEAIPSNFLLDPEGKIIAKDLRGEELEAYLKSIL